MAVYIIDYKPDCSIEREKRCKYHNKQIQWFLEYTDLPIEIVAMNYTSSDYISHARIKYFTHKEKAQANFVRELYFKSRFYKQEAPWAVFSDNDTWIYSLSWDRHCDGATFIKTLCSTPEKFDSVPIIWPFAPEESPYPHKKATALYKSSFVFKRTTIPKVSFCFVRARKDFSFWNGNAAQYAGEETQLALDNFIAGIPSYHCFNIARVHAAGASRSWLPQLEKNIDDIFDFPVETSKVEHTISLCNAVLEERYNKEFSFTAYKRTRSYGSLSNYIDRFQKTIILQK